MEKTYRFTLPKNKEVEKTNIRIENGEAFVDVEFKEKFEPKDGDFLVTDSNNVFIYNGKNLYNKLGAYAGVTKGGSIKIAVTEDNWTYDNNIRFATPEEKADFLGRLERKYHKRWNPETKQLEDIRWRAKMRERYYFVSSACDVASYEESNLGCDNVYYNLGNYYRNVEAAQKVAEQIKEIFRNSKAE